MARYGRLQLLKHPAHGLVLHAHRRPGARGGAAHAEGQAAGRRAARPRARGRAPERARPPQAGAAQARLAGRGPRRLRRRRGAPDRPRRGRLDRCARTRRRPSRASGTAARASSSCPAAPARRSSARPRWRGPSATTLILVTNTVSARQWRDELLKRTTLTEDEIGEYSGSRKEIRPGHHRHLPGDDDQAEGRLRAPRAVRRPRLGPDRSTTRCTCCRRRSSG